MSKVYFIPINGSYTEDDLVSKVEALWDAASLGDLFRKKDLAALKLHVGEPGTRTFTPPAIAAALVGRMAAAGARPFLTDTAVLYKSRRDNGAGHAGVAAEHGFGQEAMGAPFLPADGLNGTDDVEVEISGRIYDKVSIASVIMQARSMMVLSHATGHMGTGLGGALKNLGMGCCSKKAKLRQHHGQQPRISAKKCTACGECARWCPTDAIEVGETAVIDPGKCIGCGECIAVCLDGAVDFDWTIDGRELQERVVEHAMAVTGSKAGRIGYVTVALNVTKDCDCLGIDQQPVVDDIGIFASTDPVAIDAAVLQAIREHAGRSLESMSYPEVDATVQIEYAEEMGVGESAVELVTVE